MFGLNEEYALVHDHEVTYFRTRKDKGKYFGIERIVLFTFTRSLSSSPTPLSPSPMSSPTAAAVLPTVIISPCAACKILRRRCAEKCVLAPYFPPTEPAKFTIAHRVFGASNIIKFLQDLPESQRADAVASMVYEAGARIRDPVYGCAGAICQLQKQVSDLQAQLAKAQAEVVNMQMQCQQANLVAMLWMEVAAVQSHPQQQPPPPPMFLHSDHNMTSSTTMNNNSSFLDDTTSLTSFWDQLLST